SFMFLSMIPLPPKSTLFPYTTLFRSKHFYPGNPSFSHQRFQPGNMKCCRGKTDNSNRNGGHFYTLKKCIPMQPYDCADSDNFPKDRKSTRLNSSHVKISYAVFCLKKK